MVKHPQTAKREKQARRRRRKAKLAAHVEHMASRPMTAGQYSHRIAQNILGGPLPRLFPHIRIPSSKELEERRAEFDQLSKASEKPSGQGDRRGKSRRAPGKSFAAGGGRARGAARAARSSGRRANQAGRGASGGGSGSD